MQIPGLLIENHPTSDRLYDVKIENKYLDKIKDQFDVFDLLDIEYKPFLRFHITDIFNKIFDSKIQNFVKETIQDRQRGAFIIGPETMDPNKYDADFLVKVSTALTHLIGTPNFDSMAEIIMHVLK